MSKSRKNVNAEAVVIESWDQADSILAEVRRLEAEAANLEAKKDLALQGVKAAFDPDIKSRSARAALLAKGLREFTELHRVDLGNAKSRKLSHGVIGFRLGNPALDVLPRWTWAKSLLAMFPAAAFARLCRFAIRVSPWGEFVRVEIEMNRQALLVSKLPADKLREIGLKVEQEERFYYEPLSEPAAKDVA